MFFFLSLNEILRDIIGDWIITLNNFNISLIIVTLKKFYSTHWYANWLFNKFLLVHSLYSSIYLHYYHGGSQSTSDRQTDRKIIFARSMQLLYDYLCRKFYNENYGFINMSLWKHNKLWLWIDSSKMFHEYINS